MLMVTMFCEVEEYLSFSFSSCSDMNNDTDVFMLHLVSYFHFKNIKHKFYNKYSVNVSDNFNTYYYIVANSQLSSGTQLCCGPPL